MPLHLRWAGENDLDLLALTRLRCYAKAQGELKDYQRMLREDGRAGVGDYLLAERDGETIGTTTSLSMTMWVRGAALPCQGIAWVGTVRTARRTSEAGVASQLMRETIRRGRERNQVVSALMPFRVSFYEHFGYGIVEKRIAWTVPMSIFPAGATDGIRFYEPADFDAVAAARQRQCEAGQCDIESSAAEWKNRHADSTDGFEIIDRPDRDGPAHGWMYLVDQLVDGKRCVRVVYNAWDSISALVRQLRFLETLRDQYSAAIIQLPVDLPLNDLLRERQVPHRTVEHVACSATLQTRLQMRVLDHARYFENLKLPAHMRGAATIAVRESEGSISKFKLEIDAGRARATPCEASADVECRDVEWATIASGATPASIAAQLGTITVHQRAALAMLDVLSIGPAPFSGEYF